MRELNDVFNQAKEDTYSAILDTKSVEARLVFGIKIVRDRESGDIEILNTTKGGDYYEEISSQEYSIFLEKGWRYGVYIVSLSNYRRKLGLIDGSIRMQSELNSSAKEISALQSRRTNIMRRYTRISNKLNLLHNE